MNINCLINEKKIEMKFLLLLVIHIVAVGGCRTCEELVNMTYNSRNPSCKDPLVSVSIICNDRY